MVEAWGDRASAVLRALADLSPTGEQSAGGLTIPTDWFQWLPAWSARVLATPPEAIARVALRPPVMGLVDRLLEASERQTTADAVPNPADWAAEVDRALGERLAGISQIRSSQSPIRVGWLFVAGRYTDPGGTTREVFHPLVSIPVRVQRRVGFSTDQLIATGDPEVTELVTDPVARRRFDDHVPYGGGSLDGCGIGIPTNLLDRLAELGRYARSLASAASLPATGLVPVTEGPDALRRRANLRIVAGVGVYTAITTSASTRAGSLREWAARPIERWTAFHSVYLDAEPPPEADPGPDRESALVLTPVQRDAVRRSARQPVTAISGAPGTGKSHTIVAIALDALARGQDVLVAAKTDATVDALLDLFERAPGPDPVVFGSNERRAELAARLAGGQLQPASTDLVDDAAAAMGAAIAERDALGHAMRDQLEAEALLGRAGSALVARTTAPGLFDPGADLAAARDLATAARSTGGWWARRGARRAERTLRSMAGSPSTDLDAIERALDEAEALRSSRALAAGGGLELGRAWEELRRLDDAAHERTARWLAAEARSERRLTRRTLGAVAAVATALRSGRGARRTQLARIDDDKLTRALPLWLGTLPDIDDLLPPIAGLFDLVIFDEASAIDQPLAAPGLLRGKRAVIVGDPQQLRHVSFLADEQQRAVLHVHGLDDDPALAAKLDVRRNSCFDVAAAVAPVLSLDEHFRSAPHLVDFVARRLYAGRVAVATRSPLTTSVDCVDIVRLEDVRDPAGAVQAEVGWTMRHLQRLHQEGARSVGVITPFRAQADALEAAALSTLSVDALEALDLRVGTVHAFQGNERDIVIASLGVGTNETAASWRFVQSSHLFTVLATRARHHLTVLVSADPPTEGLVAEYLAQANTPPGSPRPSARVSPWTESIADDLRTAGLVVTTGYPTGRHVLDLVVDEPSRAVAVECSVHPDGAASHIRRRLALQRGGWTVLEAFPSRWEDRRGELVVELLQRVRSSR